MWSDKIWHSREDFLKHVPKDVMQSNWYYGHVFDVEVLKEKKLEHCIPYVEAFRWLEEAGYDQMPTGMPHQKEDQDGWKGLVAHCRKVVSPRRLKGMLDSVWCFTQPHRRDFINKAIDQVAWAKSQIDGSVLADESR